MNERMRALGTGVGCSKPDCLVAPAPEWILEWRAPEVVWISAWEFKVGVGGGLEEWIIHSIRTA